MALKKWNILKPDRENAKYLAEECDIDPFTALIAGVRGINEPCDLELFLSDEPLLCDPNELIDIKKAACFLNESIIEGKFIAVFGDYDCDGVVSTTIMYDYLLSRNAKVISYIPDRINEGYGMNTGAVDYLKEQGVEVIVTVDNGISCANEIEYANNLGIKTVVTDHHIPPSNLPDAVAIVDPHREDCPSSFKEVCGAQVAFKLICVMEGKEPEELLPLYSDLLSVAVIGDVMPIVNENRSIVKDGIKKIKSGSRVGIDAIISVGGIDRKSINAGRISFGIVPRINAAGRMGSAKRAFELLNSKNMLEAIEIANIIDDENSKRQQIEKDIFTQACKIIEENGYKYNRVIVVCGENWHLGIVGIVASRICEKYSKPAIVLSSDKSVAHGSGRSYSGFNLYNAVLYSSDCLLKFGGHELAAGVSLSDENIDTFRKKINEYAFTLKYIPPKLDIDFCINPSGMSVDMAYAVKELEPFGMGNPAPVFALMGVKLEKITPLSNGKHLKLLFSKDNTVFKALLFGVSPQKFCFECSDVLDLAVSLDVNFFKDEYNLSVQIKAIRLSGTDDTVIFDCISAYDDYMSDEECDLNYIFPNREDVGIIYKEILKNDINEERLKYLYLNNPGYAKTKTSVNILKELGLITSNEGILSADKSAAKTDLMNSNLYKSLYERVNKD